MLVDRFPRRSRFSHGLLAGLLCLLTAGCGISLPTATSDADSSDEEGSIASTTDPAAMPGTPAGMPGMPAATPGAPAGMPAATPGAMPAGTPGAPAAMPAVTPGATPGAPALTPGPAMEQPPLAADPALNLANPAATPGAPAGLPGAAPAAAANPAAVANPAAGANPAAAANPAAVNPGARPAGAADPARGALPGGANPDGESEGSNRAAEFEAGSAEYAIMTFVDGIEIGDLEMAAEVISDRASGGTLLAVKNQTLSENELDKLRAYTETLEIVGKPRNSGRTLTYSFNGGSNQVLRFEVEKTGTEFQIKNLTIRSAGRNRGR